MCECVSVCVCVCVRERERERDTYNVGKAVLGTVDTSGVVGEHDLDLDSKHSLAHEHVADGLLNVNLHNITSKRKCHEKHNIRTLGKHT